MNSAVEPLLKAINDLKNNIGVLEMRIAHLEGEVSRLKYELYNSTPNTMSTPYGEPAIPVSITDIRMEDGNLLLRYSDGRTETINPVL